MNVILGIDISKETFDVALIRGEAKPRRRRFSNTENGFADLLSWAEEGPIHACMEATGKYGDALAEFLYDEGITVSVVNPLRIKSFGQSQLKRGKTDKEDALVIAQFCQSQSPPTWQPEPPEERELTALVRRRLELVVAQKSETNRLKSKSDSESVTNSLQKMIRLLETEIKEIEDLIRKLFKDHPHMKARHDLLVSIPGIAEQTANMLLSEIGDVSRFSSARQVAAFAGLAPQTRQSGTSVRGRGRISKIGSSRIRGGLYMPAVSALTHNRAIREMAARMAANGKHGMVIVCAAMRKLLHIAFAVLKSGKPYDPKYCASA